MYIFVRYYGDFSTRLNRSNATSFVNPQTCFLRVENMNTRT